MEVVENQNPEQIPAPRTKEDIQKDYCELALKAGDMAFRIELEKQKLDQMFAKLDALARENAALQGVTNVEG